MRAIISQIIMELAHRSYPLRQQAPPWRLCSPFPLFPKLKKRYRPRAHLFPRVHELPALIKEGAVNLLELGFLLIRKLNGRCFSRQMIHRNHHVHLPHPFELCLLLLVLDIHASVQFLRPSYEFSLELNEGYRYVFPFFGF